MFEHTCELALDDMATILLDSANSTTSRKITTMSNRRQLDQTTGSESLKNGEASCREERGARS